MKKFLSIICCLILILSLFACDSKSDNNSGGSGGSGGSGDSTSSKTEAQYECGKEAYDELCKAAELCEQIGDVVYNAWYFAIYKADDCTSSNIVSKYASEIGLSVSEVNAGAAECLGEYSSYLNLFLDDFNYAVNVGLAALEKNGTIAELDEILGNAKSALKTMTQEYSDYSEYPSLKSLYSEVDSYATFIKDPSGSFEQLKTTIENYEKQIRTYRSDLSFVFDE